MKKLLRRLKRILDFIYEFLFLEEELETDPETYLKKKDEEKREGE